MQQDLPAAGDSPRSDAVDPGHVRDGAERDDAFWLGHEERRLNQGMSTRQYCHDNGLALSTYRYRLAKHRRSSGAMQAETAAPKASTSFIAIGSPASSSIASEVEIALCGGITLRLAGASAERVLARVLERLA
jgi:hypothetical protein